MVFTLIINRITLLRQPEYFGRRIIVILFGFLFIFATPFLFFGVIHGLTSFAAFIADREGFFAFGLAEP